MNSEGSRIMREKYESLPLTSLKEIAKARGLKGVSTMEKSRYHRINAEKRRAG